MKERKDVSSFTAPEQFHLLLDEAHWRLRKTKSEIVVEAVTNYLSKVLPDMKEQLEKLTFAGDK
jgi:hypothetical protein